jgi:hypothetical protein
VAAVTSALESVRSVVGVDSLRGLVDLRASIRPGLV